jgi:hypothetical protein
MRVEGAVWIEASSQERLKTKALGTRPPYFERLHAVGSGTAAALRAADSRGRLSLHFLFRHRLALLLKLRVDFYLVSRDHLIGFVGHADDSHQLLEHGVRHTLFLR